MKKTDYITLIHKSLTDEITGKEQEELQNWMQDPNHVQIYDDIKMIWEQADEPLPPLTATRRQVGRARLHAEIEESQRQEKTIDRLRKGIRYRNASLAVLTAITCLMIYIAFTANQGNPVELVTLRNDVHQIATLPDNSTVYLRKKSMLSYRQTEDERVASLEGEAYFKIQEDKEKPFLVNAGGALIKVTGTSFLVRNWPNKPTEVIVESGQVEVTYKGSTAKLQGKDDKAYIGEKGLERALNKNPNINSWYTQSLVFEKATLEDVFETLKQNFEVSFDIQNKTMLTCRFSGNFQHVQEIEPIIDVLSRSMDFDYHQTGNLYEIAGQGCQK